MLRMGTASTSPRPGSVGDRLELRRPGADPAAHPVAARRPPGPGRRCPARRRRAPAGPASCSPCSPTSCSRSAERCSTTPAFPCSVTTAVSSTTCSRPSRSWVLVRVSPMRSSESRRSSRLRSSAAMLRRSSPVIWLKALPSRPASRSVAGVMSVSRSPRATRSAASAMSVYGWLRPRATRVTRRPATTAAGEQDEEEQPGARAGVRVRRGDDDGPRACRARAGRPGRASPSSWTRPVRPSVLRTSARVVLASRVETTTSLAVEQHHVAGRAAAGPDLVEQLAVQPLGDDDHPAGMGRVVDADPLGDDGAGTGRPLRTSTAAAGPAVSPAGRAPGGGHRSAGRRRARRRSRRRPC